MSLPLQSIKAHFPIFTHRPELVYLDNASTTQKPRQVIEAMTRFYEEDNASAYRGLYAESVQATKTVEEVRGKVGRLLGTNDPTTIAFTSGTTESINLVAQGFVKQQLQKGDEVVVTAMEHHANFIPWQQVCQQTGARLRMIPVAATGELDLAEVRNRIHSKTKFLAVAHISNVLGNMYPIEEMISMAHAHGVPVLIDAAQSTGHVPMEVKKWDTDFLAFSAHKMFGPVGAGVLYAKPEWGNLITPLRMGGGHVSHVDAEHTAFLNYPRRVEAGTANVAAMVGLGAAMDFLHEVNQPEAIGYVRALVSDFIEQCRSLGGITFWGEPLAGTGIVSFTMDKIHVHDIASFLASSAIAVRAGHHCAQPLMDSLGIPGTVRVSFSIYNTDDDVKKIMAALKDLKKFWA